MMSYGKTYGLWTAAAGQYWPAYTRHAFVEGLRDGSLPRENFLHYLVQDYVFLIHFSRAWALAVTKADTMEAMRHCASTVDLLLNSEMQLHIDTCREAGISEDQLFTAKERTENLAYTRFVLDAGYRGDFVDLLAALAPCVIGYGEIGARLGQEAGETPYQNWIDTYASDEFQEGCQVVGALIDGAVTRRLGDDPQTSPRWASLCDTFTTATRLEVGFWDMGMTP